MEETKPTLVNVVGSGGSGTTLLGLMLANSDDGFACGEARVWFRPWRPGHFNRSCWCRENPCPVWDRIGMFPEADFHRRVIDELGARVVTDSSKWLDWVGDANRWAREREMAAVNVLIWKEPFDLIYSWWKRGRLSAMNVDDEVAEAGGGERPTGDALRRTAIEATASRFSGYYESILDSDGSALVVSYDTLVAEPAATLEQLCGAAGIAYEPGQERFWTKRHHTLFGNASTRQTLSDEEPELKRSEPSEEFLSASVGLAEDLAADSGVQATVDRLREASVNGAA